MPMLSAFLDALSQFCPCKRMDCSIARQSRFPFFFPIWSSRRSQEYEEVATAPAPAPVPVAVTVPSVVSTAAGSATGSTSVSASTQTATPKAPVVTSRATQTSREVVRGAVCDEIEGLVGLENVKRQLNGVQSWVGICRRHGRDPRAEWYGIALQGNPGTGKSTVAKLYARMLYSIGISDSETTRETTGNELASKGPDGVTELVHDIVDAAPSNAQTAGVLIVDNPHLIADPQTLDNMLHAMERETGRIIVVFIGSPEDITNFLRENPRIQRRTCSTLNFADYDRHDLHRLLSRRVTEEYHGRMQVEGGLEGQYMQVAARRLARGRGNGFTNAHAVRELVATISRRQAECLMEQQDDGVDEVDYFFFSRHDILGASPMDIRTQSEAWLAMQKLVGQEAVKASVREVFDTVEENYTREIRNQRRLPVRLNRVFAGPPGTGKTTAAKLYVQILADLGLLDSGDAPVTVLSSLHSTPTGQALIIDIDCLDTDEPVTNEVLDTLVAEMASPRENRCTILLCSNNAIDTPVPRMARRMPANFEAQIVQFKRLTRDQMEQVFQAKVMEREIDSTPEGFIVAMDILDNARMRKDFDNARAIDRLVALANRNFEERRAKVEGHALERILEAEDFDPDMVGGSTALGFRDALRHSIVPDEIISVLKKYHNEMKASWLMGIDPSKRMPCALVFKGCCGTGKKTVAKQLAVLYYKMGVLETAELVECSISDLMAAHLGQTSNRTRSQLDASRGKVLFIEDAHRLGDNDTTLQAMDELVYLLPRYTDQVVILAGPPAEMDHLLANRPRLAAMFQEEVNFRNPTPRECLRLLDRRLEEEKITGSRPYLTDARIASHREFTRAVQILSMFPCWSNARDIEVLTRWMVAGCLRDLPLDGTMPEMQLSEEQAMASMIRLFNLKRDRLRFNQDPKARAIPRVLSQPRVAEKTGVRFPV